MANQDSFIDEVTEEVRKDKLFGLFRRYGWIAAVLVLALVGGAAWNEYRKANERAAAEARGDAILAAVEADSRSERSSALAALAAGQDGGFVAEFLAAAEFEDDAGRVAAAENLLALSRRGDVPPLYRDLAALKSVVLAGDALSPEDRVARIEPLTLPGAPFRVVALEQLALARIAGGDTDEALSVLTSLLSDAEASEGLRRRARQLIVALGGPLDAS